MTGRVEDRVAFVTGAARGLGRSHAVRLAQEGADVIGVDLAGPVESIRMYPPATPEDLEETGRQVRALGRRFVASRTDVRDGAALSAALGEGVAELGRLDIVVANAGVFESQPTLSLTDSAWQDTIDINLTGVWNTCRVSLPHLIDAGRGGSMILISSTAGLRGKPNTINYTAAKHGVVGLMRALAVEFAPDRIRVNTVHPTAVDTLMIQNEKTWGLFLPGDPAPDRQKAEPAFTVTNALPVPWVQPEDVANAVLFLASDEARYITGVALPVDAGNTIK